MPSDLRFFKATTLGKPIIMGRKTFEAIGKPLPGRLNIVVTRDRDWTAQGVLAVASLEAGIAAASDYLAGRTDAEIMVIGGGEIYRQALPLAGRVYLTRLDADIAGDATFPDLEDAVWQEISRQALPASAGDDHTAIVIIYDRRKTGS
jgi:dihydrofolate reductase